MLVWEHGFLSESEIRALMFSKKKREEGRVGKEEKKKRRWKKSVLDLTTCSNKAKGIRTKKRNVSSHISTLRSLATVPAHPS